jgi:hypothetical protein
MGCSDNDNVKMRRRLARGAREGERSGGEEVEGEIVKMRDGEGVKFTVLKKRSKSASAASSLYSPWTFKKPLESLS